MATAFTTAEQVGEFLALLGVDADTIDESAAVYLFDGGNPFVFCRAKGFDWSEYYDRTGITMEVYDGTPERWDRPVKLDLRRNQVEHLFAFLAWWLIYNNLVVGLRGLSIMLMDAGLDVDDFTPENGCTAEWVIERDRAWIAFHPKDGADSPTFGWVWQPDAVFVDVEVAGGAGGWTLAKAEMQAAPEHLLMLCATLGVWLIETN